MSSGDTPDDNTPQKIWSSKDPYRYPVPQSEDSDPWGTCYKVLVEEDTARCDAWREEIQNLLIFAGLFSGVVTGFVLDSYKSLQPDPSETTNFLLAQLVSQSNGQSSPPPFVATRSSTRVNVFWFLSLMLALTTVLIGITAMQWLSEYQRYSGNLTKKENLAERNMRFEGLQEWYVPQIIAGLPLLLQGALVLFFPGMIDFLISLADRALTISVTTVMAATLLFMIMTTIFPAVQHIWLEVGVRSAAVSPPCPYKSPQSWVFLRFAFSHAAHALWATGVIIIYSLLFIPWLLYRACMRPNSAGIFSNFVFSFIERISYVKRVSTWDQFECHWLDIRDFHGRKDFWSGQNPAQKEKRQVEFDAARGVARVVNQHVLDDNAAYAAYNCFKQLEISAVGSTFFSIFWEESPDGDRRCRSLLCPAISSDDRTSAAKDENGMLFLAQFPQALQIDTEHVFIKHQLELYIRVCAFLFAGDSFYISPDFVEETGMTLSAEPLVPRPLDDGSRDGKIARCVGTAEKLQLINIFTTFVHRVISHPPTDDNNVTRFYLKGPLRGFIRSIHSILIDSLMSPPLSSSSLATHDQAQGQTIISEFSHLLQNLATHIEAAQPGHSHLALSIASSYLHQFSWNGVLKQRVVAYQRYPEYMKGVKAIYNAYQSFSARFGDAAVEGVLDSYWMKDDVAIKDVLSEDKKQGLGDSLSEKGHGGVSGVSELEARRQASMEGSQTALKSKDHESASHDPSTMV